MPSPPFPNGPTSTTKSLLIVVVAPRKFYTKPAEEDQDETVAETVTLDASSHLEQDDSSLKRQTESKETITSESNQSKSSHKSNEEAQARRSSDGRRSCGHRTYRGESRGNGSQRRGTTQNVHAKSP
mmetsp:Transcript_25342/g.45738  ORF Transcript_25342/g.45738 Transcript_25342/m.45738 type:complete len:127 (-) Transcript_25342:24-404(-)